MTCIKSSFFANIATTSRGSIALFSHIQSWPCTTDWGQIHQGRGLAARQLLCISFCQLLFLWLAFCLFAERFFDLLFWLGNTLFISNCAWAGEWFYYLRSLLPSHLEKCCWLYMWGFHEWISWLRMKALELFV